MSDLMTQTFQKLADTLNVLANKVMVLEQAIIELKEKNELLRKEVDAMRVSKVSIGHNSLEASFHHCRCGGKCGKGK